MKNIAPSILWIITGLLYVFFGIDLYWKYSTPGMLWMLWMPESLAINWLLVGALSLIIGIRLVKHSNKIIGVIFSFPIWILLVTLWSFVYGEIVGSYYSDWKDTIFNYFIIIPFIVSMTNLKKETFVSTHRRIANYYSKKWQIIILQSIVIFAIIQILSSSIPYNTFNFVHHRYSNPNRSLNEHGGSATIRENTRQQ